MLKSFIHLVSLHCNASAKFPKHLKVCTFLCLKCRHFLVLFQPICPTKNQGVLHNISPGVRLKTVLFGEHLVNQIQYTAASFFCCSTSWTDRRTIRKTGIQRGFQLQGDSQCQGDNLMVHLFECLWGGKFFHSNVSSNIRPSGHHKIKYWTTGVPRSFK